MTFKKTSQFVCLVVLDGWGLASKGPGNAISLANTPNMDRFWASYPHTQLKASGEAVGLPRGEDGNSETGHLNLGAGRIVYQDLERINMSIAEGTFFENKALLGAIEHAKNNNSNLHYMGLVGAGGVHSNIEHLFALIQFAQRQNFNRLYLHLFTDGRDSPPTAAQSYITRVEEVIKREKVGQIASIMGRYWAMDRDRRWNRTAKAYFALTKGQGHLVKNPEEAIRNAYARGKTDEFIEPALLTDNQGIPIGLIKDNDSAVFFNFRIDRPRQLTAAFIVKDFSEQSVALEFDPYLERYEKTHIPARVAAHQKVFQRGECLRNLYFVTMTEYSKSIVEAGAKVAIPYERVNIPLGRVISDADLKQLRMSESEKERFVTFYFNGQKEIRFPGEERIIVPSPDVPTYDQKPEMSAMVLTDAVLNKLKDSKDYSFILINYANPDMVGHTGNIGQATKACEVVDKCLGKIANYIVAYDGALLVTADHGNVEEMINLHTGKVDTEHSSNPVPFIAVCNKFLGMSQTLRAGILADVAPTVLALLGVEQPEEMTGRNLLDEVMDELN